MELRSRDEDNAPALSPPENDGDRADGEEIFETVFLVELLLLLSGDKVVTFFEDEETDNVGLIEDFLTVSDLFIEDPVDVVRFRFADDTGTDFLVSERLALDVGFVATEGNELLLSSGADRLTGSTTERMVVFLPEVVLILLPDLVVEVDDFSEAPPVLFRLVTEIDFEFRNEEDTVAFVRLELKVTPPVDSVFFIIEAAGANNNDASVTPVFADSVPFFVPSAAFPEDCFSKFWGFSTKPSVDCATESSIFS